MCGRYALFPSESLEDRYRTVWLEPGDARPNYNVAPMQTNPVVTADGLRPMKWGLIPAWSKEFKAQFTTINARAESLADKPMYRAPFKRQRCLVPASGFYEWLTTGTDKQPYFFTVPDRALFSFAGLYDVWTGPDGAPRYSYTIITTSANRVMEPVHDRMPVILAPEEEADWLDQGEATEQLQLMLDPLPDDQLAKVEVDKRVGNVRNNGADNVLPLNSK